MTEYPAVRDTYLGQCFLYIFFGDILLLGSLENSRELQVFVGVSRSTTYEENLSAKKAANGGVTCFEQLQ